MAKQKKTKNSDANKENNNPNASGGCCIWTDVNDCLMVECLKQKKDSGNQSGAGWKKQVWTAVQEILAEKGSRRGGEKTVVKCSNHWANVHHPSPHCFQSLTV